MVEPPLIGAAHAPGIASTVSRLGRATYTPDAEIRERATALLDAIIATADHAQAKGKQRKKALVVITDGVEKNSSWKEKEVIKAIQEDDVQVYLIGILDESEEGTSLFGKSAAKKAKAKA